MKRKYSFKNYDNHAFYHSKAWKRVSTAYMTSRSYICERCGNPATICHHKKHLDGKNVNDPKVALNFDNLEALCPLIGLEGRLITSAAPYIRRKSASSPGLQIDLLIQTPKALVVVEIKRRRKISSAIELEVQEKIEKLRIPRGKSIRTVLVYDGDLAPEVAENAFFDYLVPVERLFKQ